MKNYFVYVCLLLSGCVAKIPLSSSYFTKPTKVGLVVITEEIEGQANSSGAGGGLLGYAISKALEPSGKYVEAFKAIGSDLDPTSEVKNLYTDVFSTRGKEVVPIDEIFNTSNLKEFKAPNNTKKYYKVDVRYLKDKYKIDELLVVNVRYGLYCSYSYGIETSRNGRMSLYPNIINLSDNSISFRDRTTKLVSIRGKWNIPPAYENLRNGIKQAIQQALAAEKLKYK